MTQIEKLPDDAVKVCVELIMPQDVYDSYCRVAKLVDIDFANLLVSLMIYLVVFKEHDDAPILASIMSTMMVMRDKVRVQ